MELRWRHIDNYTFTFIISVETYLIFFIIYLLVYIFHDKCLSIRKTRSRLIYDCD